MFGPIGNSSVDLRGDDAALQDYDAKRRPWRVAEIALGGEHLYQKWHPALSTVGTRFRNGPKAVSALHTLSIRNNRTQCQVMSGGERWANR